MEAREAQQWELFAALEPFPDDKIINALAYIASIFANGQLKKKGGAKWKMDDFLIKYFTPPQKKQKPQSLSKMKQMVMAIGEAFGAKGVKKDKPKLDRHRIKYEAQKYLPKRTTPPKNPIKRSKKNG